MTLASEIERFNSVQLGEMHGLSNEVRSGVGGIAKVMKTVGGEDEELMRVLSLSSSALQAVSGSLGAMRGLHALWEMRNDLKAAEGGALTAARAASGPPGWAMIALAAGAAATASVAMYGIVNNIEVGNFDLSTSAGMSTMLGALKEIL